QLHISVVGVRFCGWICLIDAAFAEVRSVDAADLERGRLFVLNHQVLHRLETRPVKISAERQVYSQRNDQSKPEPTAFFDAREQSFSLEPVEVVEIGNSHCLLGAEDTTFERASHAELPLGSQ